ncbi:uncharacterized protein FIESC28_08044 [Fusarium coffeatum]|uniref:Uncharacterized protein n=1 Tax=Fusarium coffeatum TaxID=231269 RepID=A0A366R9E3_9HYPO|nr:uncharacterized protein FIESC28_08044 [Fusarium coffeatum]RBR13769.1 hypothetical protein FIESC28_08044 [Fusarium coffeatum]
MDKGDETSLPDHSESSLPSRDRSDAVSSSGTAASSNGGSLDTSHSDQKNKKDTKKNALRNTASTSIYDDGFTPQSYRTLRRSRLTRRASIHRQISQGRANPAEVWCNDKNCEEELRVFSNPYLYLVDNEESSEELPAAVYFQDFADAMVDKLFDIQDVAARKHKSRDLLSFVDSPPVRAAVWKFMGNYESREYKLSDKDFGKALVKARPVFLNLMFGVKTPENVRLVHTYISPDEDIHETWDLQQFILRFLVCCEVWRQQKTPRSENWKIGSREGVGQFMAAMLFNYKLMWDQECFDYDMLHTTHVWDRVWEMWLRKYPLESADEVVDGEVFQMRVHLDKTEQEVLDEVGYLGGIGQNDETYNPVQWYLGNGERLVMSTL